MDVCNRKVDKSGDNIEFRWISINIYFLHLFQNEET